MSPEAALDGVPDQRFDVDGIETVHLLNAGRRGDVDLRHVVADDVDPDKNEPLVAQGRPDSLADFAVPGTEFGFYRSAADVHVRPRLAHGRDPVDPPDGFAIHQNDALVALPYFRLV